MSQLPACLQVALATEADPTLKIFTGVALLHAGDLETAETLFKQALRKRPQPELRAVALGGMGIARKASGDLEGGRDLLLAALEDDENNWELHYHLAEAHAVLDEDLAAVVGLLRCLAADEGTLAATHIGRNPFFATYLSHPELADRVFGRAEERTERAPLLPASSWGVHEAPMHSYGVHESVAG